jgi:hypothetical protein
MLTYGRVLKISIGGNPMRRFYLVSLFFALVVAAQPSVAAATAPYYVGNCRIGAFGSISAAVSTVPPGSIIDVCPGTYSEQVVISQALTLQGIFDTDSSQAVITVPGAGLTTTSSIFFGTVAAQVQVQATAGPVKISNITVDGTAGGTNCPSGTYVGIFYSSGSSGTVNEVETRNQSCNTSGLGILAENTAGAAQSITIQSSNVHDYSDVGIEACSDQNPATLTATIKGNYVENNSPSSFYGIDENCFVNGAVSGNDIGGVGFAGIVSFSSSSPVSGNTVVGGSNGILLQGAANASGNTIVNASYAGITAEGSGTISSNRILNSSNYGILVNTVEGTTVKGNLIIGGPIGIEFFCISGNTVGGNTINGAATGTDKVPATYHGVNSFNNVGTVRTGC